MLLNVYKDQTVGVSTVMGWVARFSSGYSDVKNKPLSDSHAQLLHHKMESISISSSTNWQYMTRDLCTELQYIGNSGGNFGISQSLHQVGPMNAHTGTERTPCASLSGPIELLQD